MEQTLAPDAAAPRTGSEIELMDLLGYVYLQNNRPDKAAVLLAARDVLAPDHPRTLLTLALAQVRSAKPGRALDTLDRLALQGGPWTAATGRPAPCAPMWHCAAPPDPFPSP